MRTKGEPRFFRCARRTLRLRSPALSVRIAHPTTSRSARPPLRGQAVWRTQARLQRGDEDAGLLLAAKTHAMLIQLHLPSAFTTLIEWLDENLHADHLLS